ncbi:chemotaxis protein CheW [Aureimonas sp. Leaf454]|nr:chemotaxis protein CheW [Aureimonas sp. Leaf454]
MMTASQTPRGSEFLSVRVGIQEFMIDIMQIREIRGWMTSTPMPHSPPSVVGMINLRGTIVPVIDMAEQLGLGGSDPSPSSVVVVVEFHGRLVGLLADAVCDIIMVSDDMIQPTPDVGDSQASDCLGGMVMIDGRIVGIVSLEAILPCSQLQAA